MAMLLPLTSFDTPMALFVVAYRVVASECSVVAGSRSTTVAACGHASVANAKFVSIGVQSTLCVQISDFNSHSIVGRIREVCSAVLSSGCFFC
jgi:hypothetical protein